MSDKPDPEEPDEETAKELLLKAQDHTTLDEFMARHPKHHSEAHYVAMIEVQRRDRARFMVEDGERKQKRRGR